MSRNFDLLAEVERERVSGNPTDRPTVAAAKPDLPSAAPVAERPEMFRLVRSVFLANNGDSPRRVVFFGVDDESGSSAICADAARVLARHTSSPVCAVDANIASARLSQALGITRTIPISAKFPASRDRCAQIEENLWLAGVDLLSDGRGSLLPIDQLNHRLTELSAAFEFLIIDAPGTAHSLHAEMLAQIADGAVLVIEANKTRRSAAAKAKESLDSAGVRLLGTVLNDRTFPIPERLYKFL